MTLTKRTWILLLAAAGLVATGDTIYRIHDSPTYKLPYHDSFRGGDAADWKAIGGTWQASDGTMRNDSNERGAKLITGSSHWRDYSIEADVSLLGTGGDAGLLLRTSNEEQGVDAYSGYYAGLRRLDNALVIGRADHGWREDTLRLGPNTLRIDQWYHLKLLAYGCHIVVAATTNADAAPATLSVTDENCIRSGRAGLRSYEAGGAWRNVVIRPATQSDLDATLQKSEAPLRTNPNLFPENRDVLGFHGPSPRSDRYRFHSNQNTRSVASLRSLSSATPTSAVIRGNVILTSPALFVQDNTGGVSVPNPVDASSLKVGDEVEVAGVALPGNFSPVLEHATVRPLWDSTPIPPVTVTVSQAATGAFDATFIEVEGQLLGRQYGPNNTIEADFSVGPQSFRAVMNRGSGDYLFAKLKPGSLVRVRGVCVVDPIYTHNLTPFILLLRSTEDLDVLSGPPWWSAGHLAAIAIGALLFALVANFCYHRVERWRLHAVLEERERLAHEMHDTVAQSFAGIGFQLEAIRSGVPEDFSVTHQQLNLASELVRHSHEEARRSIASLRPEAHDTSNLLAALEVCARRMVEGGKVEIVALSSGTIASIPLRITDTLYRIGQEAIANAVRHAHPTRLEISLTFNSQSVKLSVADNGTGFVQSRDERGFKDLRGFGVRGMRKRAASISAVFKIASSADQGTRVETTVPLPARLTFTTWPKIFWSQLKEESPYVESPEQLNPNPRRR